LFFVVSVSVAHVFFYFFNPESATEKMAARRFELYLTTTLFGTDIRTNERVRLDNNPKLDELLPYLAYQDDGVDDVLMVENGAIEIFVLDTKTGEKIQLKQWEEEVLGHGRYLRDCAQHAANDTLSSATFETLQDFNRLRVMFMNNEDKYNALAPVPPHVIQIYVPRHEENAPYLFEKIDKRIRLIVSTSRSVWAQAPVEDIGDEEEQRFEHSDGSIVVIPSHLDNPEDFRFDLNTGNFCVC
jgi:hypothetical protein